jgi:hypothetical protein
MLNILKITIYLLFMQEKGDENYVKFFDKNQNLFIYFCHARAKMMKTMLNY